MKSTAPRALPGAFTRCVAKRSSRLLLQPAITRAVDHRTTAGRGRRTRAITARLSRPQLTRSMSGPVSDPEYHRSPAPDGPAAAGIDEGAGGVAPTPLLGRLIQDRDGDHQSHNRLTLPRRTRGGRVAVGVATRRRGGGPLVVHGCSLTWTVSPPSGGRCTTETADC